MLAKLIKGLKSAQGRDRQLVLNMGVSILAKGMGILNAFLLVPLYLAYLDKSSYGIWLAISSLLSWMRFFEFGLGNGLKNRLTNALSEGKTDLGKQYVSTAYFYLFLIIAGISILWLPLNACIPWDDLFNTEIPGSDQNGILTLIVVSAFLINIFFRLIQSVLHAVQKTRFADIIGFLNNLSILVGIFILSRIDPQGGDLIKVAWIAAWLPVTGLFLSTIYLFTFSKNEVLRQIRPSFRSIKTEHFKSLFGLGIRFFFIQVSMLVISQSANLLILSHFNADDVVDFHITKKYFSISQMLMTLLIAPLWPAVTDAYHRQEFDWIRKRVRQYFYIFLIFFITLIIQFYLGNTLIRLWLSDTFTLNKTLSGLMVVYYATFIFGGIYNITMNALSKLKLQMYLLGIGAILFYPLFLFFKDYLGFGIESVVLAMICANTYIIVVAPIQYYRHIILRKRIDGGRNETYCA